MKMIKFVIFPVILIQKFFQDKNNDLHRYFIYFINILSKGRDNEYGRISNSQA